MKVKKKEAMWLFVPRQVEGPGRAKASGHISGVSEQEAQATPPLSQPGR